MPSPEGLRVAGVTVRFGGVTAVDGAGLTAPPGTVTGLVGPEGAGKSTLCDVIAGRRRPAEGTVHLDGEDLTGSAARTRARHGIVGAFQRPAARMAAPFGTVPVPFGGPTVRDRVQAAARRHDAACGRWPRRRDTDAGRRAEEILARVGIAEYGDRCTRDLPPAVTALTQLARALAAEPAVLLLDEAWTCLPVRRSRALEVLLRDLAAEGLAVLVVCGTLEPVMGVCDILHVLDAGKVIAAGPPAEVRADRRVRDVCPA